MLLILVGWGGSGWARKLRESGLPGVTVAVLLALGAIFFLLNPLLRFAIFGTVSFGIGMVLFAIVLWRRRVGAPGDRLTATLAAIGSLTRNTETASAFLLVAVGVLLAILSLRLSNPAPV